MGRIVQTHSTYIEGLIKWINSIAPTEGIQTITPGVISKTSSKKEILTLKITRGTKEGFKLTARKAKSVQEVYIVTSLQREVLEKIIIQTNPNKKNHKVNH